jgi:hypothetical protein
VPAYTVTALLLSWGTRDCGTTLEVAIARAESNLKHKESGNLSNVTQQCILNLYSSSIHNSRGVQYTQSQVKIRTREF